MVAIGRALMCRPKALLLDEPSLGLAPLVVKQMFEVIEKINKAGTTVMLAEQNAYAALKIASRAYVIEGGRIVMEGSRDELLNNASGAQGLHRRLTGRRVYLSLQVQFPSETRRRLNKCVSQ